MLRVVCKPVSRVNNDNEDNNTKEDDSHNDDDAKSDEGTITCSGADLLGPTPKQETLDQTTIQRYQSSGQRTRSFCRICGTPVVHTPGPLPPLYPNS